jgi:hypothetical protein
MQKRLRNDGSNQSTSRVVAIATGTNGSGVRSVMAEMGSKGGKIGGKRRAANMSPEQRRASASVAARARWSGKKPQVDPVEAKREAALRKIAVIFEEQMTSLGLNEEEKNAKTAELVAFVSEAVSAKLAPRAKQSELLHTEAARA